MSTPVVIQLQVHGVAEIQAAMRTVGQAILQQETAANRVAGRAGDERVKVAKREATERERIAKTIAEASQGAYRTDGRAFEDAERKKTKTAEAQARQRARIVETSATMAGRYAAQQANLEIAEMRRVQAARERMARGFGGQVTKTVGGLFQSATNMVGSGMAIGAGFAVADAARQSLSAERQSIMLSNSAYNPLDPNTRRRDPRELMGKAGAVGVGANMSKTDVLKGLTDYVRLSSDASILDTNNGGALELAKLAKATGTDFGELMKMAGNARVQNKDLDAGGLMTLMRSVVGQGKAGAVELEDLAKHGGEIMATSGQYAGDQTANQGRLLGLAQFGRRVTDTAEASTSVRNFAADISRHADALEGAGVKVKARDANGKVTRGLADPAEIIANMMAATGGDAGKLGKMGVGERSMKLFNAAALVYNPAYDAAKGTDAERRKIAASAVRKEISGLEGASYSQKDIDDDFAAVMKGTSERFEKAVLTIQDVLQEKLTPWIERFADKLPELLPKLERLIDGAARVADWFASNPFAGIGAIVLASIVKDLAAAAIGEAAKGAIVRLIAGGGAGGVGGAAGALASPVGGALALGVASAAVVGNAELKYAAGQDAAADVAAKVDAYKRDPTNPNAMSPEAAQAIVDQSKGRLGKAGVLDQVGNIIASPVSETASKQYGQYKMDQAIVDSDAIRKAIADAVAAGATEASRRGSGNDPARSLPQMHPGRGGAP